MLVTPNYYLIFQSPFYNPTTENIGKILEGTVGPGMLMRYPYPPSLPLCSSIFFLHLPEPFLQLVLAGSWPEISLSPSSFSLPSSLFFPLVTTAWSSKAHLQPTHYRKYRQDFGRFCSWHAYEISLSLLPPSSPQSPPPFLSFFSFNYYLIFQSPSTTPNIGMILEGSVGPGMLLIPLSPLPLFFSTLNYYLIFQNPCWSTYDVSLRLPCFSSSPFMPLPPPPPSTSSLFLILINITLKCHAIIWWYQGMQRVKPMYVILNLLQATCIITVCFLLLPFSPPSHFPLTTVPLPSSHPPPPPVHEDKGHN